MRLNPTTVSNVVTYTVVVEATNAELKLLPGMTANLTFQIEKRSDVLTLPNAALRFHPGSSRSARAISRSWKAARKMRLRMQPPDPEKPRTPPAAPRSRLYVWIFDGSQLAAVEVTTGLADKGRTEILSGNLSDGQEVVTGIQSAAVILLPRKLRSVNTQRLLFRDN